MPYWKNYDILDTDYDNYAVLYSCNDFFKGLIKKEYAWIHMRKPHPIDSPEFKAIEEKGKQIIKDKVPGYDLNRLKATLHGCKANCTYDE